MLDLPKYQLEEIILPANTAKLAGTVMLNLFQHLLQTLKQVQGDALNELNKILKAARNVG